LVVVECGFCWDFCGFWCAERGFLRGKRGEVVVNCVAESDSKKLTEIGTAFLSLFFGSMSDRQIRKISTPKKMGAPKDAPMLR
jgi:hypothetical protein